MDYYTDHHVHYMHSLLSKGAAIHRRNFVIPVNSDQPPEWDVISEVFYEDRATAEQVWRELADPEIRKLTLADEANFLISDSVKAFAVEVHETTFREVAE